MVHANGIGNSSTESTAKHSSIKHGPHLGSSVEMGGQMLSTMRLPHMMEMKYVIRLPAATAAASNYDLDLLEAVPGCLCLVGLSVLCFGKWCRPYTGLLASSMC
jgi:hypothetical protein